MKRIVLLLLFLFLELLGYSQTDYSNYISASSINKKEKVKTSEGEDEITYLGTINNHNGEILFHIVVVYSTVKAMQTIHGHPNIFFFDETKKLIKTYYLGSQCDLPFKLSDNKLYFHYRDKNNKKRIFTFDVNEKLPNLICVAPDDCY